MLLEKALHDIHHMVNFGLTRHMPSMRGRVACFKRRRQDIFVICTDVALDHQRLQLLLKSTDITNSVIHIDINQCPRAHHCKPSTVGMQSRIHLI
ncbi:hypothetical protein D3C85_1338970 [compost metagenome]